MKSKTKYFSLFAMITVLALTLTGCANNGQSIYQAPTSGPYAWIFSLFGKPIQNIMLAVEHQIGGSNGAGWAIIIITFVVSIYFLAYMDKIRNVVGEFLKKTKYKLYRYVRAVDYELSNYLKGLVLFMIIQFFEYSLVFFIVGHPNWFLFGILASLTTVIPYFGGLITNLLALLTASVISPNLFIATVIICLIFPQLDGYVISPRVYGKTNNINPLVTIMMVSIGGTVFGVLGIVIALPIYIVISSSYRFFKNDIKKGVKKVKAELS